MSAIWSHSATSLTVREDPLQPLPSFYERLVHCGFGVRILWFRNLALRFFSLGVEHLTCNQKVGGSIPPRSSAKIILSRFLLRQKIAFFRMAI